MCFSNLRTTMYLLSLTQPGSFTTKEFLVTIKFTGSELPKESFRLKVSDIIDRN